MRPLLIVFWGLVVVVLDLWVEGYDVVVDAVGWLLVVVGTLRLRQADPAFTYAIVGAVVGGIGSVHQLVPGYILDDAVASLLAVVETLALTALVVGTCAGVERILAHEPKTVQHALVLRKVYVGLTVVALVWSSMPDAPILLFLGVVTLAVLAWFLVFLLMVRNRPGLDGRERVEVPAA
jgi:hypothetical protein